MALQVAKLAALAQPSRVSLFVPRGQRPKSRLTRDKIIISLLAAGSDIDSLSERRRQCLDDGSIPHDMRRNVILKEEVGQLVGRSVGRSFASFVHVSIHLFPVTLSVMQLLRAAQVIHLWSLLYYTGLSLTLTL